jgi:hypothetical protein
MQSDKCMKKRLIAIMLLLCLAVLTVTLVETARAQSYIPGVQLGDDFYFSTYSYWSSTDAYASIPSDLVTANQTLAIEVRISDANQTTVTTFTASYYTNANPVAARGTVNILTGDTTDGGFPAILAANLTAGQLIHPSGSDGITINDTLTMNTRPTNHIGISVYNATSGVTATNDRYFDQVTGMLVQEIQTQVDSGAVSGTSTTIKITTQIKSSPWNPQNVPVPEFPPILAIPIFIGATTLIVIGLKKKHLIAAHPAIKS